MVCIVNIALVPGETHQSVAPSQADIGMSQCRLGVPAFTEDGVPCDEVTVSPPAIDDRYYYNSVYAGIMSCIILCITVGFMTYLYTVHYADSIPARLAARFEKRFKLIQVNLAYNTT